MKISALRMALAAPEGLQQHSSDAAVLGVQKQTAEHCLLWLKYSAAQEKFREDKNVREEAERRLSTMSGNLATAEKPVKYACAHVAWHWHHGSSMPSAVGILQRGCCSCAWTDPEGCT